jgi:hypothetical protein
LGDKKDVTDASPFGKPTNDMYDVEPAGWEGSKSPKVKSLKATVKTKNETYGVEPTGREGSSSPKAKQTKK